MTDPGHRTVAQQSYLVTRAAAAEAVRAGRAEVDVEHLLLALLASGGRSAEHLLRAGVDVAGLRQAVADLEAEDLGSVEGAGASGPPRPAGAAPAVEAVPARSVPVDARVQAVLDQVPLRSDEAALLAALLADSPRAQRLLHQQGVDVPALRAALAAPVDSGRAVVGAGAEDEAYDEPGPSAPPGWRWEHVEHRQVLPVQAADEWALVSDPAQRAQWDPTCAGVHIASDGSGSVGARAAGRDRLGQQVVTRMVPGSAITWARRPDAEDVLARAGATVVRMTSIRLAQDQSVGAVLHLRAAWLVPSRRRWLRWSLTGMFRQLRPLAQGIVQAAPGAAARAQQQGDSLEL